MCRHCGWLSRVGQDCFELLVELINSPVRATRIEAQRKALAEGWTIKRNAEEQLSDDEAAAEVPEASEASEGNGTIAKRPRAV